MIGKKNKYNESDSKNGILKKAVYFIIISSIFILLVAGIIIGYRNILDKNNKKNIVKTQWGSIELDVTQSKDMVNLLLMGLDKGGYRTDTLIIVNFNPITSHVNLISIPRDTLVVIDNKKMKLNSVFTIGKFSTTMKCIKQLTGLPINYYIAADTNGFRTIIDTLGGVNFDVKRDMRYSDPYQGLSIDLKKGFQLLDGNKAEQLVRYRKYIMGDLEREEVQKEFIKALVEQKLNLANISNIAKMKTLYNELKTYVETNLDFNDGMNYFASALKINSKNINTYILPGQPKDIGGVSYYIYDKNKTISLFSQLFSKTPQEIENSFGKEPNIQILDIRNIYQSYSNNAKVSNKIVEGKAKSTKSTEKNKNDNIKETNNNLGINQNSSKTSDKIKAENQDTDNLKQEDTKNIELDEEDIEEDNIELSEDNH